MTKTAIISELRIKPGQALSVIAEQSAMLAAQSELIASQNATIVSQGEAISRLETLLGLKGVGKTSSNSHIPPSSDLARKNQSLRPKSDRPAGGQPGHKGITLKMSDTPDSTVDLHPSFCNCCGLSLSGLPAVPVGRRQLIDIPPISPVVTEYRNFSVTCTCGHRQKADFPEGIANHVQYGENIQSMVVYNSVYQLIPFLRLQYFFEQVASLHIGKGTMENMIRRSADKAQGAYGTLRKAVEASRFVGSDETGAKLGGGKMWFWVWQNEAVTYISAATSRSKQVIADNFPAGFPNAIICSDRLAAQLSTSSKGMQICLAHLLRDLNYLIETEKTAWATDFKALLKDAMGLKRDRTHYPQNDPRAMAIEAGADKLLSQSLSELGWTVGNQPKTITFRNSMAKLRHALFTFLYHADVPFDNNGSERAIRSIKVKTKISGQFKSLHGEFAVLRSVIGTAVKNGKPVYDAIRAIVAIPKPESVPCVIKSG